MKMGEILSWDTGDLTLMSNYLFLPNLYEHIVFEVLDFTLSYEDFQTLEVSIKFKLKKEFVTDTENILAVDSWKTDYYTMDEGKNEILYPIIGIAVPGKGLFSISNENINFEPTSKYKGSITHQIVVSPNQRGLDLSDKSHSNVNYIFVRNLFLFGEIIFDKQYDLKVKLFDISEFNNEKKLLNTKIGLIIPFGKSKLIEPSLTCPQTFDDQIIENKTFLPIKSRFYPGEGVGSMNGLPCRGNEKVIEGNKIDVSYPCTIINGPILSVWNINNKISNQIAISVLCHDHFVNPVLLPIFKKFYGDIALPVHINAINMGIYKRISVKSTDLTSGNSCLESFDLPSETEINIPLLFPGLLKSSTDTIIIKVEIYLEGNLIQSENVKLLILPPKDLLLRVHDVGHDWYRDTLEAIACWVTPDNKKVEELVEDVKIRIGSSAFGKEVPPISYLKALWDELKYRRTIYNDAPISIGSSTRADYQPINPPETTLKLNSGNCLELSLVFASVMEKLSLEPWIILVDGHAFLGWETNGKLFFLETTFLDSETFNNALKKGMDNFNREGWKAQLKISNLREQEFKPLF